MVRNGEILNLWPTFKADREAIQLNFHNNPQRFFTETYLNAELPGLDHGLVAEIRAQMGRIISASASDLSAKKLVQAVTRDLNLKERLGDNYLVFRINKLAQGALKRGTVFTQTRCEQPEEFHPVEESDVAASSTFIDEDNLAQNCQVDYAIEDTIEFGFLPFDEEMCFFNF